MSDEAIRWKKATPIARPDGTHASADLPQTSWIGDTDLPPPRVRIQSVPREVVLRFERRFVTMNRLLGTLVVLGLLAVVGIAYSCFHLNEIAKWTESTAGSVAYKPVPSADGQSKEKSR